MEPRKAELKKTPEQRKDARKSRFQIVKLEERIAPCHRNMGTSRDNHPPRGGFCI